MTNVRYAKYTNSENVVVSVLGSGCKIWHAHMGASILPPTSKALHQIGISFPNYINISIKYWSSARVGTAIA